MTNSPAEGSRAQKEVEDLLPDTVPGTCQAENGKGDRQSIMNALNMLSTKNDVVL